MDRVENEEYLEQLWYMKEKGEDSFDCLVGRIRDNFDVRILRDMVSNGLVETSDNEQRIVLTAQGEEGARMITRRHRLAERLLHDVLGMGGDEFETEACEFEHVLAPDLVDSICILLGHPRECPHGHTIPKGECCRKSLRLVENAPRPLTTLKVSDQGRVAFVQCERDAQMHQLDGLQIRPGILLKLHQTFPTYVIECEGAHIALEERVAKNIHVWIDQ